MINILEFCDSNNSCAGRLNKKLAQIRTFINSYSDEPKSNIRSIKENT
jgi:hypothetical protein